MKTIVLFKDQYFKTVAHEFAECWQIQEFSKRNNGNWFCESVFSINKEHIKQLSEIQ